MKRLLLLGAVLLGGLGTMGAGCSGDPNIESARLNLRQGDLNAALVNVDAALQANPNNVEALEIKAQVLRTQATAANVSGTVALEKARSAADTYRLLARTPAKAGMATEGLSNLYRWFFARGANYFNRGLAAPDSAGLWTSAVENAQVAIAVAPDSADAYQVAGYALARAGRTADALAQYRAAIARNVASPRVYLLLAELYLQDASSDASKYNDAIAVLEAGAQRYAADLDIQTQLLNAYRAAGRTEDALRGFAARVQADPNNGPVRLAYGTMLLNLDRFDEAIVQLNEATRLAGDDGDAQYNLGAAYTNQAAALSTQINAKEDAFSRDRARLSAADRTARQAEIDALKARRNELFRQASGPLDRARELYQAAGKSPEQIRNTCLAAYQAYTYSGQTEKAATVRACAGL